MASKISWTHETWNPVAGCSILSPGCANCYAMRMAHRLAANPLTTTNYEGLTRSTAKGPRWTGILRELPERLGQPKRWRKPRLVFVNSMSDLLHEAVSMEYILQVFAVMRDCPRHTFQVLTKRAERLLELEKALEGDWPPNVWMGVSVESQEYANDRIPKLLLCQARVRFASCEPLLGPLDLTRLNYEGVLRIDALNGWCSWPFPYSSFEPPARPLDWVIVGCESGPGARPMELEWVRALRDQCLDAETPFFFKQAMVGGKKVENPPLDGCTWTEMPERGQR